MSCLSLVISLLSSVVSFLSSAVSLLSRELLLVPVQPPQDLLPPQETGYGVAELLVLPEEGQDLVLQLLELHHFSYCGEPLYRSQTDSKLFKT
jgi:hypothetical protein